MSHHKHVPTTAVYGSKSELRSELTHYLKAYKADGFNGVSDVDANTSKRRVQTVFMGWK